MHQSPAQDKVTIAVIGDIHDLWELEDNAALSHLKVDLAIFLGDYGNEAVEVVRRIAAVKLPKVAVMGNHDAYYSASNKGIKNCPYDRTQEDWVQLQMDLLGEAHIGFSKKEFPQFNLTVVGGRPFSWGGSKWRYRKFYRDRFDVRGFDESSDLILAAADEADHSTVIFVGHVGPLGLGSAPDDPCGKDWGKSSADYGDPDFAKSDRPHPRIRQTRPSSHLRPHAPQAQKKTHTRSAHESSQTPNSTVYFNAANVPRIEKTRDGQTDAAFLFVTLNGRRR